MAAHYVKLAREVQPAGPYRLIGASFGGMLAYEMGRQLSLAGQAVPLCALLDTPGPGALPPPLGDDSDAEALSSLAREWIAIDPERLRGLSRDAQLQCVLDEARRTGVDLGFSDVEQGRRLLGIWKNNVHAMYRYVAPRWDDGELQFFRAIDGDPRNPERPESTWIDRCRAVRVEVTTGNHTSMLKAPHALRLGTRLRACLTDH